MPLSLHVVDSSIRWLMTPVPASEKGDVFSWTDIRCHVNSASAGIASARQQRRGGGKSGTLDILRGISGIARSSELVAVVGG